MTAYQITSMMEGVVLRGTGAAANIQKEVGKPLAGKTGTTNDEKDVWFVGFSPDLVVGVFMGGLGLGGRFFGPRADRRRDPLRFYALLELGVAAAAAATPALLVAARREIGRAHV